MKHLINNNPDTTEVEDINENGCMNPRKSGYKYYGGRGIQVCNEWLYSFENFLNYLKSNNMYPKPAGLSIDRINNDGNYEPGNIRWATQSQQNYNQRHFNSLIYSK